MSTKLLNCLALSFGLFWPLIASAQLVVTVSPLKIAGNKIVIPLVMKNNFAETVESARVAVFLLNEQGKMVAQSTRWVIGGSKKMASLGAGETNTFHFVVTTAQPITTTNLAAKVSFNRVVLEGGKLANVNEDVQIKSETK